VDAVHLRHTDKDAGGDGSNDTAVIEWAGRKTARRIFVAADNPDSVASFHAAFPGRVTAGGRFVLPEQRTKQGGLRETTLFDAFVDLWVASYSTDFHGVWGSTFSWQIEPLRRARHAPTIGYFSKPPIQKGHRGSRSRPATKKTGG